MNIMVDDIESLHKYVEGITTRADCHAPNVNEILNVIIGRVLVRSKPGHFGPGALGKAKQYNGRMANLFWFASKLTGREYCCVYNHNTEEIELRDSNIQGAVLHTFTNATPIAQVMSIVDTL